MLQQLHLLHGKKFTEGPDTWR